MHEVRCRLQNGKTQWYTKMLLLFAALFAVKHGVAAVADSLEKVQAGLFSMLIQNVSDDVQNSHPAARNPCKPQPLLVHATVTRERDKSRTLLFGRHRHKVRLRCIDRYATPRSKGGASVQTWLCAAIEVAVGSRVQN